MALLTAVPTAYASGPAARPRSTTPAVAAHQAQPLDPEAADAYLQSQRAGVGTARQAAAMYARGVKAARALPVAVARDGRLATAPATFTGQSWQPIGPFGITHSYYGGTNSGRVTGIAVSSLTGTADTVYLGAAGGGVWKASFNGTGTSWSTSTDSQPDLAVGAVSVDPYDPSIVFAGTGESNYCGDCYYGLGIMESTDGGTSWTTVDPGGIFTGLDVSGIAWLGPDTVLAGTTDPAVSGGGALFMSSDGGATWTSVLGGDIKGLAVDTLSSPEVVTVGVLGVGIEEATYTGSTNSIGNFLTLDVGSVSSSTAPDANLDGVAITEAPAANYGSTVLYVSAHVYGVGDSVYKSTDGGQQWQALTAAPQFTDSGYAYGDGSNIDQGYYDNAIAVDPLDPQIVVAAGEAAVESTDGGASWVNLNGEPFFCAPPQSTGITGCPPSPVPNSFHPDFHALTFDAAGNLYLGNDGGIWELPAAAVQSVDSTTGSLGTVSNTAYVNLNTNLDITQFYANPAEVGDGATVLAGAQDNGTALYTGAPAWTEVLSGDGGQSAINPLDTSEQFGQADSSLYWTIHSWTSDGGPLDGGTLGGNFVVPMALTATAATAASPTVYFGGNYLYSAVADPVGVSAGEVLNWGLVAADTNGTPVSALATDQSGNYVYAGFDSGTLMYEGPGSNGFQLLSDPTSPLAPDWVTGIAVDPSDPQDVVVTQSCSNNTYLKTRTQCFAQSVATAPQVTMVTGVGTANPSFTDVTGNLPPAAAANAVVDDYGTYIVATDVGVFETGQLNGSATTWAQVGGGLPTVQVLGLTLTSNGTLLAATHGRGVWEITPPTAAGGGGGGGGGGGATTTTSTTTPPTTPPTTPSAPSPAVPEAGYWMVGRDGGIFSFGGAHFHGSLPALRVRVSDVVGIAPTADGGGYWMVGRDGGVFDFGDATFHGSLPGLHVSVHDVVGIVPTADGRGYWMVGSDGGVFAFGDAHSLGSVPGLHDHVHDVVAIAGTPDNAGYWVVGSNGRVFAFGDAKAYGSAPASSHIAAIARTADGKGYWLLSSTGHVYSFGDAKALGSPAPATAHTHYVGILATRDGGGFWAITSRGAVAAFGDATVLGSLPGLHVSTDGVVAVSGI